jgi:hypothetical protein
MRSRRMVKSFFRDRSFRPPLGVPVTAKYAGASPFGGIVPLASLMDCG